MRRRYSPKKEMAAEFAFWLAQKLNRSANWNCRLVPDPTWLDTVEVSAPNVRPAGLKDAGRVVEARRSAARRCEDRAIEEVVALRPEFEVLAFHHHELLGHGEVELADARTAQGIAAQVAERAGLRNRESRRIDIKRAVAHVVGVDSWNYVGSAYVAAVAAAGDVDHRTRHDHAVGN